MGQNVLTPFENSNLNFRLARDQVVHLEINSTFVVVLAVSFSYC